MIEVEEVEPTGCLVGLNVPSETKRGPLLPEGCSIRWDTSSDTERRFVC